MILSQKKKLMVVVGAGASIELGMPSVKEIDQLFARWSLDVFKLADNNNKSLYCYIKERIDRYYGLGNKKALAKRTNFEEILYILLHLSSTLNDDLHLLPTNAFFDIKEFPKVKSNKGEKTPSGYDFKFLNSLLIDRLISEFRIRCKKSEFTHQVEFKEFKKFINSLVNDFDAAFITLNYDNLITQACPNLFTGFDNNTGIFDISSIYNRNKFGLIYHLHGSVCFDMHDEPPNMHTIKWNSDLNSIFKANSAGRNSQETSEGVDFPTSVIVAGYGKATQIQRVPFRTYYSKIDEISHMADAFLFLGYGFNDYHLNNSLHAIRDGKTKRPVVVIDYADDSKDPMQFRHDEWSCNLCKTIPVNAHEMATRENLYLAPDISMLKIKKKFEISTNPSYPLSIWYSGFIDACKNYQKIKAELERI